MSRTGNVIKNSSAGIRNKIIALVLGFASRTIFIYYLGNEYLGISGLYTEVLSMLSLAELGFGSAMSYAMYAPVAKNDNGTIAKLLNFYKNVYRVVAIIVLALGLVLIPFLPYIINGADSITLFELKLYYCIFLFNTVVNYFVSYKYCVVNAYQKNYIVTNIDLYINTITIITQIVVMLVFKSYTGYLISQSILLLISRIIITNYLNKKFPVMKEKNVAKLTKEEKEPIITNVKGMAIHKFASLAVHSTDNIIISMFSGLGVVAVGMISNYTLLTSSVLGFVTIIFGSFTYGFGNLVAESTVDKFREIFLQLNFMSFWIYGFCSIAFFILVPPFITLWIGAENVIDTATFFLIILNIYMCGQCAIYHNARIAKGEFNRDKWISAIQAIVNLIVSMICANLLGLVGIYIGTVVSRLVYVCFRPASTYKFLFGKSAKEYYKLFAIQMASVIFAGGITFLATVKILNVVTILNFLITCVVVAIVPNVIFFILYFRNQEFKNVINRIKSLKGIVKNEK